MNTSFTAPQSLGRLQRLALIGGIVCSVVSLLAFLTGPANFFRAYLVGFIFCLGLALGGLAFLMLQYLTGGAWGLVIRRILEAAARTLPVVLILFIPVLAGMGSIYPWVHTELIQNAEVREIIEHKHAYLNVPFFIGRAAFFFAVWLGMTFLLSRWGRELDETRDPGIIRKLQDVSGPGLVLYGLTITFAAVDWVMSIDPAWYSTIFGLLLMAGEGLSAMAFTIAVAAYLAGRGETAIYQPRHFHDLGKLLLTLIMLWAYFSFSQFLIIWSGNLPEEIPWYLKRFQGGWGIVGLSLVLLHFAFPFAVLLSRDLKRNYRKLVVIAALVMVMRLVDLVWLVAPQYGHIAISQIWVYVLLPLGLGGIWLWYFIRQLESRPLVPVGDPNLEQAIAPEHQHGEFQPEH
jgi:hypothetical protein